MLFADLLESRAFRKQATLEKYSVKDLSEILFLHLLALQLLHNCTAGEEYARQTLIYPLFDGIRFSATDLGNLIATLKHADRYLDERSPAIPIFELKRWLRSIIEQKEDRQLSRAVFYKLQTVLKIHDGRINSLRRNLVDSHDLTMFQKLSYMKEVYRLMQRTNYNSDLVSKLHKHLEELDT